MGHTTTPAQRTRPVSRVAFPAMLNAVAAFSVLQSMVLPALPKIRQDLHASVTATSRVPRLVVRGVGAGGS